MTKPLKKAGFRQGIYAQSSTAKEVLGTYRLLMDGRGFRYAKAGAADLAAGKMGLCAALDSAVVNEVIVTAVAIGDMTMALTVTAGTAIAENELLGGQFQVQDGTGEGQSYGISGNSAISASGTAINIALTDPVRVALDTTSEFNLVRSPWWAVYESATGEQAAAGVAPIAVTTLYYYWAQTKGLCAVLQEATDAVGCNMCVSTSTAGAVVSVTNGGVDADLPFIGTNYGTAGATGEYTPVILSID